jgi:uncharacterized lipoprotein YbaY
VRVAIPPDAIKAVEIEMISTVDIFAQTLDETRININ